jgi:hypothetical protein
VVVVVAGTGATVTVTAGPVRVPRAARAWARVGRRPTVVVGRVRSRPSGAARGVASVRAVVVAAAVTVPVRSG